MRIWLILSCFALVPAFAQAGPFETAKVALAAYESTGFCGGEGARCTTNLDCCRGSCMSFICRSTLVPRPCKANGSSCSSSYECCSGMCLGRCQPRIEP
jgi:hypothetical protein